MSVLMANPDYLLEGFAEKRCQVSESIAALKPQQLLVLILHISVYLQYFSIVSFMKYLHIYFLQYIGVLDGIATSQDLNDRAFLLRNLDNSRVSTSHTHTLNTSHKFKFKSISLQNSGKLPWQLGMENDVSVTISAFNLKIIHEDRTRVTTQFYKNHNNKILLFFFRVFCIDCQFMRLVAVAMSTMMINIFCL